MDNALTIETGKVDVHRIDHGGLRAAAAELFAANPGRAAEIVREQPGTPLARELAWWLERDRALGGSR